MKEIEDNFKNIVGNRKPRARKKEEKQPADPAPENIKSTEEFTPQRKVRELRSAKLQVVMTPKVKTEIEKRSKKAGMSKSDYVYQILLHYLGME